MLIESINGLDMEQCSSTGTILNAMSDTDAATVKSDRNAWLPFEILGEIFHHVVCVDGPLTLRHIIFVCKLWYTASIQHPQLWTRIFLDRPFFTYFKDTPILTTCAFLKQCLDRSGSLPLSLRLGCDDLEEFRPSSESTLDFSVENFVDRFLHLLEVMKQSDKKHIKRCESLIWRCEFECDLETQVLSIFPPQLPLLRFLSVSKFEFDFDSTFPHCPSLAEVELSDHHEKHAFFPDQDFARVKTLSFNNNGLWMGYDILCIARFASLETLVLSNGIRGDPEYNQTAFHADEPLLLPHLRVLTVRGTIPKDILLQLVAPSLLQLLIEDDNKGRATIHDLHILIPPSCHQIHARLSPMVKEDNPIWFWDLASLLKKLPQVNVFYVSKWMQKAIEDLFYDSNFELRVDIEG